MKQIFSAITMLLPILSFAESYLDDPVASQIILNEQYCVQSYEGRKIYLNPNTIYPGKCGIYIDLNGKEGLIVPFLQYDANGEFIIANEIKRYYCPNGHRTDRSDRKCYFEDCPYYFGGMTLQ